MRWRHRAGTDGRPPAGIGNRGQPANDRRYRHRIVIAIEGMGAVLTAMIALDIDHACRVADRPNRPLGDVQDSWTAFAARSRHSGLS